MVCYIGRMLPIGRIKFIPALFFFASFLTIYLISDFVGFANTCGVYSSKAKNDKFSLPRSETVANREKEAIVVLAGDRNRIGKAMELLRIRGSRFVLVSGTGKGITLSELIKRQEGTAIYIHEIWKKIHLESQSNTTIENAAESAPILERNQITRVILVTSEYHMPRALEIFRKALPRVEFYDYPVLSDFSEISMNFSQTTLSGIWKLFVEYWKYFLYRRNLLRYFSS